MTESGLAKPCRKCKHLANCHKRSTKNVEGKIVMALYECEEWLDELGRYCDCNGYEYIDNKNELLTPEDLIIKRQIQERADIRAEKELIIQHRKKINPEYRNQIIRTNSYQRRSYRKAHIEKTFRAFWKYVEGQNSEYMKIMEIPI